MALKEWTTLYPTSQDPDPVSGVQPDLNDESFPGAGDGDLARTSQVEALRDKLHAVAKFVGDTGANPTSSLRYRVNSLEAQGFTEKKIGVTIGSVAGNYDSTTVVPEGATILEVIVEVTVAYNGSATLGVILNGASPLNLQLTTESRLDIIDIYIKEPLYVVSAAQTGTVRCTVDGTPSVGAARAIVRYADALLS